MLNLNAGELEWLSNHLGHTVDVHKEYYRNQESAVEMGKIASMLLRLDRNTSGENGKNGEAETFLSVRYIYKIALFVHCNNNKYYN